MSRGNIYIPYNATAMLCTYDLVTVEYQVHHCRAMSAHRRFGGALQGKVSITMSHGRQSGLEPFKTVQHTGLHPTSPAFFAWQKFSQVKKTGICEPIGTHTRKRHLQTVFVHARLGRQLTCLRHLSLDLSWILPGSLSTQILRALRSTIVSQKTCECESPSFYT